MSFIVWGREVAKAEIQKGWLHPTVPLWQPERLAANAVNCILEGDRDPEMQTYLTTVLEEINK